MGHTIKQQLEWASDVLSSVTSSARLDSEILLAYCLDKDRSYLITWPERELDSQKLESFHQLVQQRLQPQPIAYLTGFKEFYSLNLKTTPATLVPRPETEMLVDKVLQLIDKVDSPNVLELGTGTGAIALAIKKHADGSQVLATDISKSALDVAKENAGNNQLDIEFVLSDWFDSLNNSHLYDVIVSNPPYIALKDPYLNQGDLPAEPQLALSSGDDGLQALSEIISKAGGYLKPNGWLVLEHGYDQQSEVTLLLEEQAFEQVNTHYDFNDLPRMTVAKKPSL